LKASYLKEEDRATERAFGWDACNKPRRFAFI